VGWHGVICAGVILSVMGAAFFFYVLCAPHPWPVCLVCAGTDWLVPKSPVAFHTLGLGLLPVCISISPMPTSLCLTGIVLAMHYTPHVVCAGVSIEHILREVYGGWLLRHAHANGASLFFLAVYLHLFRGLALGHAWRVFVWCVGVLLLLLSVLTAFVGYVLPWGQMSFWGATVITSLASAFPVVGNPLVTWLWGGLSVENATLNRFLSLHYLLPFILACHSMVHLAALHQYGSNHPLVGANPVDKSAFLTDSLIKDLVGWVLYAIGFSLYAFFTPIALGHPDNSIHANPLTTPAHIVPEWYFLAFYAILRSIPNKQAGVASVALVFFTLGLIGISGSDNPLHARSRIGCS
jgi:ubiquinol-cytochrome c reductase cytochrome b subunit